jgi:membrane protein CcdC involved in cytochrome C biogenesis
MPIFELLRAHPVLLLVASLAGAGPLMVWRYREAQSPVSARKILVPPLAMSTGLLMFLVPATRVPAAWAIAAFLLGALVFAIPMSRTSRLTRRGDEILMQRSKAFLWILGGLVLLRFALRAIVERYLSPMQTGALFFLLAFGMIVRWRGAMFLQYRRLRAEPTAAE